MLKIKKKKDKVRQDKEREIPIFIGLFYFDGTHTFLSTIFSLTSPCASHPLMNTRAVSPDLDSCTRMTLRISVPLKQDEMKILKLDTDIYVV